MDREEISERMRSKDGIHFSIDLDYNSYLWESTSVESRGKNQVALTELQKKDLIWYALIKNTSSINLNTNSLNVLNLELQAMLQEMLAYSPNFKTF